MSLLKGYKLGISWEKLIELMGSGAESCCPEPLYVVMPPGRTVEQRYKLGQVKSVEWFDHRELPDFEQHRV